MFTKDTFIIIIYKNTVKTFTIMKYYYNLK